MNGKTIAQIAVDVGVSKQAIQKRIKKEPLKTLLELYTTTKGVTTYIDDAGVSLIKSEYGISAEGTDNYVPDIELPKKSEPTTGNTDNQEPREIIIKLPTTTEEERVSENIEVAESQEPTEIEKDFDIKCLIQNVENKNEQKTALSIKLVKYIVKTIGAINVVVLLIVCYWFGFSVAVISTIALITAILWTLCNCLINIAILSFKNKDI